MFNLLITAKIYFTVTRFLSVIWQTIRNLKFFIRSSTDESMSGAAPPQSQYGKGDFVYVQGEKGSKEPSVVQLQRLWTNSDGVPMVYANVYFRYCYIISYIIYIN